MGKNFKKFRSKARIYALLSSILYGIGVGVAVIALAMIFQKLSGTELDLVFYFIGIGAALVVATSLYFILMPSNVRLARRLDKLYSLDERLSTMVEFDKTDGGFYQLQREDAEQKLGEKNIRSMKSTALLSSLLTLILSVVLAVGAFILPVKAAIEEPIDEFDKQWILTSLDELIVMVQNSYMTDGMKDSTLKELNNLVDFVKESNLLSEMKKEAINTVVNINQALTKANTAVIIGEKFKQSSDEKIVALGEELVNLTGNGTKKALAELADSLVNSNYNAIEYSASEIDSYLTSSGVVANDAVYVVFKSLVAEMRTGTMDEIKEAFDEAGKTISPDIVIQNVNVSTTNVVISTLCTLFGITQDDLKNEGVDIIIPERDPAEQTPDDGNDKDDPDQSLGSGGLGTGDVIYAGSDMVFDPRKNTYVPYGELLNEYFAKANEKITDGKASEDIADLAEDYFGSLFGSYSDNSK